MDKKDWLDAVAVVGCLFGQRWCTWCLLRVYNVACLEVNCQTKRVQDSFVIRIIE